MKATWVVLSIVLSAAACDPDDPCDPGYYADHGLCVRNMAPPRPAADGGAEGEDAGSGDTVFSNDDSDFGRPCEVQTDCGGKAPECGAPELPLCTAINCLQGESQCPADWICLDISSWERPYPYVKSICVQY